MPVSSKTLSFKTVYFSERYLLLQDLVNSNSNCCFWKLFVGLVRFFPLLIFFFSIFSSNYLQTEGKKIKQDLIEIGTKTLCACGTIYVQLSSEILLKKLPFLPPKTISKENNNNEKNVLHFGQKYYLIRY